MVAVHPDQIAMVELRLAREASAAAAADAFLRQEGLTPGRAERLRVNGLAGVAAPFEVPRQTGSSIAGRAVFVELGERVFRLMGLAVAEQASRVRGDIGRFLDGFARLTDRDKLDVRPQRLALVELPRAMSFEEFLRRHPSEADARVLALINGVEDPAASLPAGTLLKRIVGERRGD